MEAIGLVTLIVTMLMWKIFCFTPTPTHTGANIVDHGPKVLMKGLRPSFG